MIRNSKSRGRSPRLTKTAFLDYRACRKAFWLRQKKPEAIEWPEQDDQGELRKKFGYEVEAKAVEFINGLFPPDILRFQDEFETPEGLFARPDVVKENEDGSIDLLEVKSSNSAKPGQIDDLTFQVIVAEEWGARVRTCSILHLNKNYVRKGELELSKLFKLVDVTEQVRRRYNELSGLAHEALALLQEEAIDEVGCDCRRKPKGHHCAAFAYFNADIKQPSFYMLPNISEKKVNAYLDQGLTSMLDVPTTGLTKRQLKTRMAAERGAPVISRDAIRRFVASVQWPLYFYDYETINPPIPQCDGQTPNSQWPIQFSLHRLSEDGTLSHAEYLADDYDGQRGLIEGLLANIGPAGSLVAWHASFEKARNETLGQLYPEYAPALTDLSDRTVDLEVPFISDYVDIGFKGSSSIKNVLPVICPDLTYADQDVKDGNAAMAAWVEMTDAQGPKRKAELRQHLLSYCKLDTLAMVRIFQFLRSI